MPMLDIVMVMSVNPGFAGQSFIPQSVGKIRRLRRIIDQAALPAQGRSGRRYQSGLDGPRISKSGRNHPSGRQCHL